MHTVDFDITIIFNYLAHFVSFAKLYEGYDSYRFEVIENNNYRAIKLVAVFIRSKKTLFVEVNLNSIRNELDSKTLIQHFHDALHNKFVSL